VNKNLKAGLIVGAVLALLAGFGWHAMSERAEMTAAAAGTVLKSEFVRDTESSSLDETRISYRFEVDGKPVEGADGISGADRSGDYPAGRSIQVCYNPEEPTSSRLNQGGPCT
jgi:hypothetical protein